MSYRSWLSCGGHRINLDTEGGDFELDVSYTPTGAAISPVMAAANASDHFGGAELASIRAQNTTFALPVIVRGQSGEEVTANFQQLDRFLHKANDGYPVTFHFSGNSDTPHDPVWGQLGGAQRFEIEFVGSARLWNEYGMGQVNNVSMLATYTLTCRPYPLGIPQRVASATGGIIEDVYGSPFGSSRGLIVAESVTNKFTNPVFGNSDWDNGWSATSDLEVELTLDPEFVLHGRRSAKLTSVTAFGVTQAFTQSLALGNTNDHTFTAYLKMEDGSDPSGKVWLWHGVTVTGGTTTALGNGWYRFEKTFTPTGTNVAVGVAFVQNKSCYLSGVQLEERSYSTPLCHGDMLGCSWSSTAHLSSSTRSNGNAWIGARESISLGYGTVAVAVKPRYAFDDRDFHVFEEPTSGFRLTYDTSAEEFVFSDGTSVVSAGSQTFSEDEWIILHCTWSQDDGISIYQSGALADSGISHRPIATDGEVVYLGNDGFGSGFSNSPFSVTFYSRAFSASEVAAQATAMANITANDYAVDLIPFMWSLNGDNVADNTDAGSDIGHVAFGGIAGRAPAITRWELTPSNINSTNRSVFLSLLDVLPNDYFDTSTNLYDAGGASATDNVNEVINPDRFDLFFERDIAIFASVTDTGSGVNVSAAFTAPSLTIVAQSTQVGGFSGTGALNITGSMAVPPVIRQAGTVDANIYRVLLALDRAPSGSTGTLTVNAVRVLFEPVMELQATDDITSPVTVVTDGRAVSFDSGSTLQDLGIAQGSIVELRPDRLNIVQALLGKAGGNFSTSNTVTFNRVDITPRWGIV